MDYPAIWHMPCFNHGGVGSATARLGEITQMDCRLTYLTGA